ncbi:histidine phosphatase family protein [Paenibacillus sp. WQ 127069]|uniref:Histidine phosphatase family protein n=1 Tax=Paenibacillus baimaensis TaxID=2982185 RepID=A0ABT2UDT8_9BACL|nr:histidine phosphatase family protein [Paenibacillus sp. WQ 127069]MCU6792291.1 histidine phosphatase family protein [Paenibacillus sp. WQ 127069]
MTTDFYLVRHAKKEKGIGDVAISSEGILEAQATAHHFREIAINKIVSSPLKRAKQTAMFIAKETKTTIAEDIRLRERANWGDIPGQTFEEFVEMWERCVQDRDFSPPAGDSARKAGERLALCLLELSVEHSQDSIIVVTHGGLITDFLVNVITEEELRKRHPNFLAEQSYLISECSITKVSCQDGIFKLDGFATVDHLL